MKNEIIEKVDRLSDVLVHVIYSDLETIADLSDWFGKLAKSAIQTAQLELAAVTKAAELVLEKIIVDGYIDKSQRILTQKTKRLRSYQTARTKVENKNIIKALLIYELENIVHFHTGDISCRETILKPRAENTRQKSLI